MADTIKPYDRAQNNYASGVVRTNAENIRLVAAKTSVPLKCAVKVVPVDIQGTVLTGATVTLNGTAGTVADVGNSIAVATWSTVTVKVELAGYQAQEFSIAVQDVNILKEVTLMEEIGGTMTTQAPVRKALPHRPNTVSVDTGITNEAEVGGVSGNAIEAFKPFNCMLKISDAELSDGEVNKEIPITISNTCPLSETGKARFPGCTDLASAIKSMLVDGALELKSTNVVPGAELVLKSPFRVSDVIPIGESWGHAAESSSPYSKNGLYAVAARTIIYFYLLDEDGEVAADDQYLCRLAYCDEGFTRELPVVEEESGGIKQKVNFLLTLGK